MNKIHHYKKTIAFTLSEVLIALLIIGVVASIVIPNIMAYEQNLQYITGLRKAMGTLNNGFKLIMANSGCSDIICTNVVNADANITMSNIVESGAFNIKKKCNVNETGCHDKYVYYMDGTTAWKVSQRYSVATLGDGIAFGFYGALDPECNYNFGSGKLAHTCGAYFIVDINGEKSPNKFGKDVFRLYLLKGGEVVPVGMKNDTRYGFWNSNPYTNGCYAGDSGETCAARIVEEGWEMNY